MSIFLGGSQPTNIFLGSNQIQTIYSGGFIVYNAAGGAVSLSTAICKGV